MPFGCGGGCRGVIIDGVWRTLSTGKTGVAGRKRKNPPEAAGDEKVSIATPEEREYELWQCIQQPGGSVRIIELYEAKCLEPEEERPEDMALTDLIQAILDAEYPPELEEE